MIIKRWRQASFTVNFTLTSGQANITGGSTAGLIPTMSISGTGIPAGTTISFITGSSTLTMSQAATVTGQQSLTFSGGFVKEFPETKAQLIRNNADSLNIFDSNDKLKPEFLPNSVFDSLRFFETVGVNSDIRNLGLAAVANATAANRSAIGYYWVASAAVNVGSSTGTVTVGGVTAQTSGFNAGEERFPGAQLSADLEPGDWFILTAISGAGTVGSPYTFTYAVVNNTYEVMGGAGASSAGYQGLVPGPGSGQNLHFLRGDGTWVIPTDTNTTYSGSTSINLSGTSFQRAALTGDVTAALNDNATTIATGAVTFAKMQDIATANMLGRTTAGTGDIELLSASAVRTFLNVANGATANTGTVTGVTGTLPIVSSGGTAPVISINAATTSAAGSMSSADKTKLEGIATGATANSTDATLLARANHTGTQAASTISDFATAVAATASVTANTAKVSNATHTGDVTGSGALTIAANAVTLAKMQDISSSRILGRITANNGDPEQLTADNVRSIIELAAPIYIQTAMPTATVTNALWYDIN